MLFLWKAMKIVATAVGVLAVLYLIGNAGLISYTGARLEERLKKVRDAGDPVSLKDLAGPPIPAERNAAVYLRRARADLTAISKDLAPLRNKLNIADGKFSEEDVKELAAAFKAYPKLFPLLEKAADCPEYQSDLDFTAGADAFLSAFLEHVQKVREVANLFSERSLVHLAAGKRDEALRDAVRNLRLARHTEREPLLIGYLVACAVRAIGIHSANRVLRWGPVSKEARAELDAELARADDADAYVRMLKSERAYGNEMFRTNPCINWWTRAYFNDDQCFYLDLIARQIELAPKTYADALPALNRLQEETAGTWRHRLSNLFVPAATKVYEAHTRLRALVRCLRVLNALQAKAGADAKAVPKLEDLGLPAGATADPYNGKALLVRRVGCEWLIYAVGSNLTDDRGQIDNLLDVGIGPVPEDNP